MTGNALQLLQEVFSRYSHQRFLVLSEAEHISYGDFWQSAEAMAARLAEFGVKAEDRVLLRVGNGEPVLRLYLACGMAGVAVCPIDPAGPAARLAALTREIQPKLVVDAEVMASLTERPTMPFVAPIVGANADFLILYSSGTTGEPKGIAHSVRSLLQSARSFSALSGLSEDSVVYHHFPMYYMAGIFNLFLCPAVSGASIVLGQPFSRVSMLRFWEIPQRFDVNHLTLTPTMAHSLTQLYRTDDRLLSHLQHYEAVISTGSTLYPSVAKRFLDTFGVPLRSCYGVTEVGGSITLQDWAMAVAIDLCVGDWQPGTEIRAGESPDQPDEIFIRTPTMMNGYFARGHVTPFVGQDGFFATGDRGFITAGRLHVVGRTNDSVKKGGEFVSLADIENHALSCPLVTDVAAIGVPDESWGNRIVLFYVPEASSDGDQIEKALGDIFALNMRRIEHPDKLVPVPWFPKTSIGKTIKHTLLERYMLRW